jgi:transcription termination factor Rho
MADGNEYAEAFIKRLKNTKTNQEFLSNIEIKSVHKPTAVS